MNNYDTPDYFQDYTVATPWEEYIANLEAIFDAWSRTGDLSKAWSSLTTEYELDHNLPERTGSYTLSLHLPEPWERTPSNRFTGTAVALEPSIRSAATDVVKTTMEMPTERTSGEMKGFDKEQSIGQAPAETSSAYTDAESKSASRDSTESGMGRSEPDSASETSSEETVNQTTAFTARPAPSTSTSADDLREIEEEAKTRFSTYGKLRRWFGVDRFVVLSPNSFSGRLMDEQEATLLLSSLAVAAKSTRFCLPCFVPVRDGFRDAYWGFGIGDGRHTQHFETDSVHISSPPPGLQDAGGLLALFAERLSAQAGRSAACCKAYQRGLAASAGATPLVSYRRTFTVQRLTEQGQAQGDDNDMALWRNQWDEGCAWWPWASQNDPCSHLELDIEWQKFTPAELETLDTVDLDTASCWRIHALAHRHVSWLMPSFLQSSSGTDRPRATRQHLRLILPSQTSEELFPKRPPRDGSLSAMLTAFWEGRSAVNRCNSIGQLTSDEWWARQGSTFPAVPPEGTLQDVLRDLFGAVMLPAGFAGGRQPGNPSSAPDVGLIEDRWGFSGGLPKCAPASSLAARLALHAVTFSNPRAVATLWTRFVRELRFSHWEPGIRLPRMAGKEQDSVVAPKPDLRCGILHQKLQMLDYCIAMRRQQKHQPASPPTQGGHVEESRVGAKRVIKGLTLLANTSEPIREPWTLSPPVMTEDMLLEKEAALSAIGDLPSGQGARLRLQGDLLSSDMSAFRAANPGAQLADFVRWHSPKDWLPDDSQLDGGKLSPRIGGVWLQLWDEAPSQAAEAQKPLMDPQLEGERVMHWFEHTLSPEELWLKLMPVAINTSAALLTGCSTCEIPLIAAELDGLQGRAANSLVHQPVSDAVPQLLFSFQLIEAAVVAAESLSLTLPKQSSLVSRLLKEASRMPANGETEIPAPITDMADPSPFWDGFGQGQLVMQGNERNQISQQMQSDKARAEQNDEWESEMQSEWLIELDTLPDNGNRCRLSAFERPGDFRIATCIVAES